MTRSLARPTRATVRLLLPALALLLVAGALAACRASAPPALLYRCPMHPDYVADAPRECPLCGMRLVPYDQPNLPFPSPPRTRS